MRNLYIACSLCALLAACAGSPTQPPASAEAHRPAFHFSPDSMWMNDPNGMVFYEGEYHLFYQYHPASTVWGPMHWGHALSRDLLHWEDQPIALYPDSLGYIFSGSAVVDSGNSSGLGQAGNPPLVALFTHHDPEGEKAGKLDFQVQSVAYSLDRGRSWAKYAGNPVLRNPGIRDFRDPKVFRHAASGQWVMVLAVKDRVHFYTSPDLKTWAFASEFGAEQGAHGGVWECPDLFELPLAGGGSRWVLLLSINPGAPNGGSGTQYFIGQFDGQRFRPDPGFDGPEARWLDYGRDNYAGVSWSGVPASDGRRLFIGWMSNWSYAQAVPTQRWRSAMTLPRSLRLATSPGGLRLASLPAREAEGLRKRPFEAGERRIEGEEVLPLAGPLLELDFEWEPAEGESPSEWGLRFFNARGEELRVGYRTSDNQYFIDRRKAGPSDFSADFAGLHLGPREASGPRQRLQLWLDLASVELFADSGLTAMTDIFFPREPFSHAALYSLGGAMRVKGRAWELAPLSAD